MEIKNKSEVNYISELLLSLLTTHMKVSEKQEYKDLDITELSLVAYEKMLASLLYERCGGNKTMLTKRLKSLQKTVTEQIEILTKDFPFP